MKSRFDSLDTTAMVAWMQRSLIGRRVVNVYDGDSGEAYVFKLDGDSKTFFIIESGIRFHSLIHFEASSTMPSPFCAKMRKHLRGLRLESVEQLGHGDRVVLFQFGVGPSKHALILELYAKGNIILTNGQYSILSLLRSHVYAGNGSHEPTTIGPSINREEAVSVQVGQVYPVTYATTNLENQLEILASGELENVLHQLAQEQATASTQLTKKKKKATSTTLKTLLLQKSTLGVTHYGPALIEHCVLCAGLDPNAPLTCTDSSRTWVDPLREALQTQGPAVMQALERAATIEMPGYILYKSKEANAEISGELPHVDKHLEEFVPHLLQQHEGKSHLTYKNFNLAVADFFEHIGTQRKLLKSQAAEMAAEQKLEKIRRNQQERLESLQREQELVFQQAKVIQHEADVVDKALTVINSALDSGMDWEQLESLVEVEQTNRNPIALLIHKLQLASDEMILELPADNLDPVNSSKLLVSVKLKLSAYANANALFDRYRASKEKASKTVEASVKALAAAEESAKRQLMDAQKRSQQTACTSRRKPLWFEKFHYFVTSDNYLVVGGRDAHQNEQLVKRYLRPGDAYLHADIFGAASCILRAKRVRRGNGKTETLPLSEQALREAGNFTVCRSSAWSSKIVTSAWWVEANQVSKTAPTGEYLTVGSFMIRGKKNFLPPSQLEMGLAVLFRISDDDIDGLLRHKNERRDFAMMALEEEAVTDHKSREELRQGDGDPESRNTKQADLEEELDQAYERDDDAGSIDAGGAPVAEPADDASKTHEVESTDNRSNNLSLPECRDAPAVSCAIDVDNDNAPNGEHVENSCDQKSPKKKGLSVRDRKLIRKYGSLERAAEVLGDIAREPATKTVAPSASNTTPQKEMSRGKKAKLKRAMKKYADQDEEDKELAMRALQGGEKTKNKGRSNKAIKASETQLKAAAATMAVLQKDASQAAMRVSEKARTILANCVPTTTEVRESPCTRWDKFDARVLESLAALDEEAQVAIATRLRNLMKTCRIDNFSASLGGIIRRVQKHGFENLNDDINDYSEDHAKRKSKAEKQKEEEQWRLSLAEEGLVAFGNEEDLEDDALDDTIEVSKLTGKPHADDLLVYAIPVCAPYQTLAQYTFKVKLTPGNLKRGKATKQCLEIFSKQFNGKASPNSQRWISLIKNISDNEWLQNVCADVKISAAGASKLLKQQKSSNKKKSP